MGPYPHITSNHSGMRFVDLVVSSIGVQTLFCASWHTFCLPLLHLVDVCARVLWHISCNLPASTASLKLKKGATSFLTCQRGARCSARPCVGSCCHHIKQTNLLELECPCQSQALLFKGHCSKMNMAVCLRLRCSGWQDLDG